MAPGESSSACASPRQVELQSLPLAGPRGRLIDGEACRARATAASANAPRCAQERRAHPATRGFPVSSRGGGELGRVRKGFRELKGGRQGVTLRTLYPALPPHPPPPPA
ncbi:hypothetical protein P7K49_020332 [Saguinus oedipus]|uniref:Uncharacterized protein n=1 Tax=Saguinus oedipus TaxID=9490 RepID=A0ABQ9V042_SAGOE|nr:hypothetical protein P7K49_020332 [Saguinus oedipus]